METPIEFKSLVGTHVLTGVQMEDKYESPDHYTSCKFTLDGITYAADECPDDGYRSYTSGPFQTDSPAIEDFRYEVECSMMEDELGVFSKKNDVLLMKLNGEIIFKIGTENTDDYYPWYTCEFTPPKS